MSNKTDAYLQMLKLELPTLLELAASYAGGSHVYIAVIASPKDMSKHSDGIAHGISTDRPTFDAACDFVANLRALADNIEGMIK